MPQDEQSSTYLKPPPSPPSIMSPPITGLEPPRVHQFMIPNSCAPCGTYGSHHPFPPPPPPWPPKVHVNSTSQHHLAAHKDTGIGKPHQTVSVHTVEDSKETEHSGRNIPPPTQLRGQNLPGTLPGIEKQSTTWDAYENTLESGRKGWELHRLKTVKESRFKDKQALQKAIMDDPALIATDSEFFQALRDVYLGRMCGFWRRAFFLTSLRGIRLLSFTPTSRPTIVPLDDFVLKEVLYAYQNPSKITTTHKWIDWVFRLRQPGRRHALEFVEGWDGTRIAVVGSMPLVFSTLIGIIWSVKTGNIQNAFAVAGFILTAGSLLLALLAIISGIESSGQSSTHHEHSDAPLLSSPLSEPPPPPLPHPYVAAASAAVSAGPAGAPAAGGHEHGGMRAIVRYDYGKTEDSKIEVKEGECVTNINMIDEDGAGAAATHATPILTTKEHASPPSPPLAEAGRTATAHYDYEAAEDNEITFPEGAKITNLEFPDDDWWMGEYEGKSGLFPSCYVQLDD